MPCALVRAVQALSVTTMKALIWSWMLQPSATTPGLVEMDRARLVLGEQLQLEPLRRREGIDVVLGRIEVREGDVRADRNDRQERMELQVLLRDDVAAAARAGRARRAGGIERDDASRTGWPDGSTTRTLSGAAPSGGAAPASRRTSEDVYAPSVRIKPGTVNACR